MPKYVISKVQVQEGFESKTVYQVVDKDGTLIATCDTREDAKLEIENIEPLAGQQKALREADAESVDQESKRSLQSQSGRVRRSIERESGEVSKSEIDASERKDREKSWTQEEQKRHLRRRSPVIWRDGSDTSGDDESVKRYRDGKQDYWTAQAMRAQPEYPSSNPDTIKENSSSDPAIEVNMIPSEAVLKMAEAVAQLSPMQHKAWQLVKREMPITFEEAAKILGISRGALGTHLRRAERNIRKHLGI